MPSFVRPSCILLIGAVVFSFQACGGDTAGPLPPARVAFATAPATPVAGETFSPAVQVEVQNEQGERVRGSSFAVTVQLSANPNGGVLQGTTTRDAVDGVATFDNLRLDKAGNGYKLRAIATDYPLTPDTTDVFSVNAGPVVLSFLTQPGTAEGQVPFNPAIEVNASEDQFGNPVVGAAVTLSMFMTHTGEALRGTTTRTAMNGVATFDSVRLAFPGSGFVLEARSGSATPVRSNAFNVRLTFVQTSVGDFHTCGVTVVGYAYCWGLNTFGSLGDSTNTSRNTPTPVAGGLRFSTTSAGSMQTCAVGTAGLARCWGYNIRGQVGDGTDITRYAPTTPTGNLPFMQVATAHTGNDAHTCGVTTDSTAYCWGINDNGRLGDSTNVLRYVPTRVQGTLRFVQISTFGAHVCGLAADSTAYCWGANFRGQLGDSTTGDQWAPTRVMGSLRFTALSAGGVHTCGLASDGAAYCWGDNSQGQLGDGTNDQHLVPTAVAGGISFLQLSSAGSYTCGVATSHQAYCWGYNYYGNLGDGTTTTRLEPTPVTGGLSFSAVSAGRSHTCGVSTDRILYCWGENVGGQLGDSTYTSQPAPHLVRQ